MTATQHNIGSPRARDLRSDLVAGVSSACFAIPQSMGFALIAGLSPDLGLRTSFAAGLVAALVGSSFHVRTSTNNAVSVVVGGILLGVSGGATPAQAAMVLAALVAVYQVSFAVLRLGNLTQFLSHSVLQGFTLAAAVLIILSQVKNVLGVQPQGHRLMAMTAIDAIRLGPHANLWSVTVAVLSFAVVFGLHRWSRKLPLPAITLVVVGLASWLFQLDRHGVAMLGTMPTALFSFSLPDGIPALMDDLAGPAFAVALIATIQSITIAKALGLQAGQRIDANREILGQGMGNIAAAAAGGMPASASFGVSFVGYRAGSRTRSSAVISALLVGAAIPVLGPVARHLPVAALGGMLIAIALRIPNWEHVRICFRATRSDATVLIATFVATLAMPIDRAIFIGIAISLALYLRKARSPYLTEFLPEASGFRQVPMNEKRPVRPVTLLHLEGDLFFGASDLLEEELARVCRDPALKVLVLRMRSARNLDATSTLALKHIAERMVRDGRHVLVAGASIEVDGILRRTGITEVIGPENVFLVGDGVLQATGQAMRRARELVAEDAELRVLYDRDKGTQ